MAFRSRRLSLAAALATLMLFVAACGDDGNDAADETTQASEDEAVASEDEAMESEDETTEGSEAEATALEGELVGVFAVTAGACDEAGVPSGSHFRMLQPEGDLEAGPFIPNADSPCADDTYLPLTPGTDGGLVTGAFQPPPDPPFDETGNGLADAIFEPATFFGVDFAVATSDPDPQSGESVSEPMIVADGVSLSGDVSALSAYYGGEVFNQGAPKPDGSTPGATAGPAGQIVPETGEFTLEWNSQISGGAFDGFTGVWHLEGVFEAS